MTQAREEMPAELHATIEQRTHHDSKDMHDLAGGDIKKTDSSSSERDIENVHTPDDEEPTEHEINTLRRIGENLPMSCFLIAVVELCERFTYYGASGIFQNYVSHSPDGSDGSRGLGLGQQAATGLSLFFQFFCYVTPILGAIIADQYWGKYKTIVFFAGVYIVGLLILWTTALPVSLAHGAGVGGYVTSLVVIGLGTGGIKSNISPLIADQYQRLGMAIKTLPTGERVIIDPAVTYQRIYMIFYGCINLGSLSLIITPFMEDYVNFFAPYLLCFCMFCVGFVILVLRRKAYIVRPPTGSVITNCFRAIGLMIASGKMDAAKPSWREANGKNSDLRWDDHFVDELKRALVACKVFTFYPIFWVCYNQMSNNFVSQAGEMADHGLPNDVMQVWDPISIIIFIPILDRLVYPLLRKLRIPFRPMVRITVGFLFAAAGIGWGAVTQKLIYSAGPCYDMPNSKSCAMQDADGAYLGNNVHVAVQSPAYLLIGLGEIFLNVTGLEYAYTKAPPSMKSFVQSLYLFTNAFAAALGEALVPVSKDPQILWMYTGVAGFCAGTAIVFWFLFHDLDDKEDEFNQLNKDAKPLVRGHEKEAAQGGKKADETSLSN